MSPKRRGSGWRSAALWRDQVSEKHQQTQAPRALPFRRDVLHCGGFPADAGVVRPGGHTGVVLPCRRVGVVPTNQTCRVVHPSGHARWFKQPYRSGPLMLTGSGPSDQACMVVSGDPHQCSVHWTYRMVLPTRDARAMFCRKGVVRPTRHAAVVCPGGYAEVVRLRRERCRGHKQLQSPSCSVALRGRLRYGICICLYQLEPPAQLTADQSGQVDDQGMKDRCLWSSSRCACVVRKAFVANPGGEQQSHPISHSWRLLLQSDTLKFLNLSMKQSHHKARPGPHPGSHPPLGQCSGVGLPGILCSAPRTAPRVWFDRQRGTERAAALPVSLQNPYDTGIAGVDPGFGQWVTPWGNFSKRRGGGGSWGQQGKGEGPGVRPWSLQ